MTIPENPWPELLRARFREQGFPVDEAAEEFAVQRGEARTWGYVHPRTGQAVVFVEGRQHADVWRADTVREHRARCVPPALADVHTTTSTPGDGAESTLEKRYLTLLQKERTLAAELRLVVAEREHVERQLATSMIAARLPEVAVGAVTLRPRRRIAVHVTEAKIRVEELRAAGLQRWVRESVDHASIRREVGQAIETDLDGGLELDSARRRFFAAYPVLTGKLVIDEQADLAVSGERQLYDRERLAWTHDEDATLLDEYRNGARLATLVERHRRPPSDVAKRLAALLDNGEAGPGDRSA